LPVVSDRSPTMRCACRSSIEGSARRTAQGNWVPHRFSRQSANCACRRDGGTKTGGKSWA
jgi:hypothetical protein